jgi:hypothetical protein
MRALFSMKSALVGSIAVAAVSFSAGAQTKTHALPVPPHVSYDRVVTFKKGSSEISAADKEALAALMQTVKDRSQKIEQIHVAAWADKASDFSSQSRQLAASRVNAIQDHLEGELAQSYVDTFNMNERANWFVKALTVNPRDLKKIFAQKGAPQNVTPEDFALVRSKGGAMKAVLLVEIEPVPVALGTPAAMKNQ